MTAALRWFVPGRLEVFGKHTDYAGGRTLVAAVPRGITVTAFPATDGRIVAHDAGSGELAEFSSNGDGPSDGWRRYPRTVIRRLAANFPDADLSARIELSSDLPQGAGISSSSALVIGIAEALIARGRIEASVVFREAIRTLEDRAAYFGCIENGAAYRSLAGDIGVGTHGGSEDHAAILLSRAGELRQFSFSPLRLDRVVAMPAEWTFVIASTGVVASKAGAARADYNRAVRAAGALLEAWREQHPGDARSLGEIVATVQHGPRFNTVQHGSTRATVRHGSGFSTVSLRPELRARLEHFVAEDARVVAAADAFAQGDIGRIGELAAASQADAARLLENQVPETGDMVALARAAGAAAASGFGAGWGGSVWALVPAPDGAAFLEGWLRAYRARHPRLPSGGFVSPPSPGLIRL